MNLYTFKEFRTVLDTVSSVNDYNTYIQWESDIVPADSPFKDFNNKEDNTNIQHIALMLPSKDIVILISFEEEIANHSMYNSNTVFFNSMIDKIKDCVESLLWTNIEVKLELVCELYRAQIKVMKFLTNNKILILEDCLKVQDSVLNLVLLITADTTQW